MASSSLCGPSNPLQNLQKHTGNDRQLQQDRILRRHRSAAAFRSQPVHPSAANSEFETFSGIPQDPLLQGRPAPLPFLAQHPIAAGPATSGAIDGWASDFLNLNINSGPAPSISQQKSRGSPMMQQQRPQTSGGSWHQEFLQQQQQEQHQMQHQSPQQMSMSYGQTYQPGMMNMGGQYGSAQQSGYAQSSSSGMQASTQYTDQDFEQMFNEVALEQEQFLHEQPRPVEEPVVQPIVEESETKEETETDRKEDADELARTAGQLLDTLKHDTSEKFQQSNFLMLMRKLRDHEVKVQDGKMVETGNPEEPIRGDADVGAFLTAKEAYDSCFGSKDGGPSFRTGDWEEQL